MKALSTKIGRQILKAKKQILKEYNDTLGLVLIGSVAEGDYGKDSDIDIVCIKRRKVEMERRLEFMDKIYDKIQLVVFTKRQILNHFRHSTTMAYSIKNGITLYQKDEFINSLFKIKLSKPSKIWMKEWFEHWRRFYQMALRDKRRNKRFHKEFCKNKCYCEVGDYLARATVNFAILYLETQDVIPTTKSKISAGLRNAANEKFRQGLKITLDVHHFDRNLREKEADSVFYTADWLRQRLRKLL